MYNNKKNNTNTYVKVKREAEEIIKSLEEILSKLKLHDADFYELLEIAQLGEPFLKKMEEIENSSIYPDDYRDRLYF